MSACLWGYHVLSMHRARRDPRQGATWLNAVDSDSAQQEKHFILEQARKSLGEQFLQYCEPVVPHYCVTEAFSLL